MVRWKENISYMKLLKQGLWIVLSRSVVDFFFWLFDKWGNSSSIILERKGEHICSLQNKPDG